MNDLFNLATNPEQYTTGQASTWMADNARQQTQHDVHWNAIKKFIPANCRSVLDIGCGSGWAAQKLHKLGVKNYVGLEPSTKNYAIAKREHPKLSVLPLALEEYPLKEYFDCVLALMVFSHIADPKKALQKISSLLNMGGVCIITLSCFHPPELRQKRNGREYQVEVIDDEQYVDQSIKGTSYGIADINRSFAYYQKIAHESEFIIKRTKFTDPGYSPKLLMVLSKAPRCRKQYK